MAPNPGIAGLPVLRLGSAETTRITALVDLLRGNGDANQDSADFVAQARRLCERLPRPIRLALRQHRRASGPTGALLLRGLPVGTADLPPTPDFAGSTQREVTSAATALLLVALALGEPIAFAEEKSGSLVQDVVPVPGMEENQSNVGSVMLWFHTENAFHPHRPDHVLLLCLRGDPAGLAKLRITGTGRMLPLLGSRSRRALATKEFVTEPPLSFAGTVAATLEPHAILAGDPDDPDLRVDFYATRPLTAPAKAAMAELAAVADAEAVDVSLETGDLAILDNRRAVHGRTYFEPAYDGSDRWLQRAYVLTDIRGSRAVRGLDGQVLAGVRGDER